MYDNETGKHFCDVCGEHIDTLKPYMLSEGVHDDGLEAICHRHMHELGRFPAEVQKILQGEA